MAKDDYWTQVEIEASVRAYLEMLEQEIAGHLKAIAYRYTLPTPDEKN